MNTVSVGRADVICHVMMEMCQIFAMRCLYLLYVHMGMMGKHEVTHTVNTKLLLRGVAAYRNIIQLYYLDSQVCVLAIFHHELIK